MMHRCDDILESSMAFLGFVWKFFLEDSLLRYEMLALAPLIGMASTKTLIA